MMVKYQNQPRTRGTPRHVCVPVWHGLDRFLDPHDILADKGYQGLDLITPVKKLPGGELTDDEKHLNRHINHHRVVIERVIAHFKCWRVLSSIFR